MMKGTMTIIQPTGDTTRRTYVDREVPLADLNKAVGGYIEVVPYFKKYEGEPCVAFCNEYGKVNKLPTNPLATAAWIQAVGHSVAPDYLVGPVVILTGDEEFMTNL